MIDICEISLCGLRCGPLECVLVLVLRSDACRINVLSPMSFFIHGMSLNSVMNQMKISYEMIIYVMICCLHICDMSMSIVARMDYPE